MAVKFALLVLLTIAALWMLRFLGILATRGQQPRPRPRSQRQPPVEETQRCAACGTYVPIAAPSACGRTACPYPRLR